MRKILHVALIILIALLMVNCSKKKKSVVAPVPYSGDSLMPAPTGMHTLRADSFSTECDTTILASDELPVRVLKLSPFYIDSVEVDQKSYLKLTGKNPSFRNDTSHLRPVEKITWFDAVLYCNALSKSKQIDTVYSYGAAVIDSASGGTCTALNELEISFAKNGYRLPTEAEWEFACRGGVAADSIYYWGSYSAALYAIYLGSEGSSLSALKLPNNYGLYDMSGNVAEWCNDWYASQYDATKLQNPTGELTGTSRVYRGGHWLTSQKQDLRFSKRYSALPTFLSNYLGFRTVRPAQKIGGKVSASAKVSGMKLIVP